MKERKVRGAIRSCVAVSQFVTDRGLEDVLERRRFLLELLVLEGNGAR